jgi:hypothetical protein
MDPGTLRFDRVRSTVTAELHAHVVTECGKCNGQVIKPPVRSLDQITLLRKALRQEKNAQRHDL